MIEWVNVLRQAIGTELAGRPTVATLATVDEVGQADARSIVVREVADDGSLAITSDARSRKNAQLRANRLATLVLWLPVQRRQFRTQASVEILGAADPRARRIWLALAPPTRATFHWPQPGGPVLSDELAYPRASADDDGPSNYEVLVLRPVQVEELDVTLHPYLRRVWRADEGWAARAVSP